MILRRNERSARREVTIPSQNIGDNAPRHHYYHRIMDNTSYTNANKASAASSWSPSKWVAGLMGREAPVAAATDVGSGQVGSGRVGPRRVGWDQVGSARIGSGRLGSGHVGSGGVQVGSGWVGLRRMGLGRVRSGWVGSGPVGGEGDDD